MRFRSLRKKSARAPSYTRSHTVTARANRVSARNARQQKRRNSVKKSYKGGFFEKFVSDLKKAF